MAAGTPVLAFVAALLDEVSPAVEQLRITPFEAPYEILAYGQSKANPAAVVVVTGWGEASASTGARWLVNALKPAALVSVGYSGGTTAGTAPGTLAVGTSLVRIRRIDAPAAEEPIDADPALCALARHVLSDAGFPVMDGPVGTTSVIAESASDKAAIGRATGVVGVDLESWHSARVASDAGIPFLAVRGIVDTVEMELPGFVSKMQPGPRPPAAMPALRHVVRHPTSVGSVVRTGLAASKARRAMSWFIQKYASAWAAEQTDSDPDRR